MVLGHLRPKLSALACQFEGVAQILYIRHLITQKMEGILSGRQPRSLVLYPLPMYEKHAGDTVCILKGTRKTQPNMYGEIEKSLAIMYI